MKLIIINKLTECLYIGYGDTLLECIYDLSSEKIKEGIFANISDYYSNNNDFLDDDEYNSFIEKLSNYRIKNRIYSWCNHNNYNYLIKR